MSSNLVASLGLQFRAPGGANVSEQIGVTAPFNAQSIGTLDIPAGTVSGTSFAIPFGSVASPKGLLLCNGSVVGGLVVSDANLDMKVQVQAVSSGQFQLPAGGVLLLAQPVSATAVAVTGCNVVTTVAQVSAAQIDYAVWGD